MKNRSESTLIVGLGQTKEEVYKLQQEWYARLKREGFHDIETVLPDGSSSPLLKPSPGAQGRRYRALEMETRQDYYTLAGQYYWANKWLKEREKEVWKLHSEGLSYRKIIKALRPTYKIGLQSVTNIIKKHKKLMHLWAKKEVKDNEQRY